MEDQGSTLLVLSGLQRTGVAAAMDPCKPKVAGKNERAHYTPRRVRLEPFFKLASPKAMHEQCILLRDVPERRTASIECIMQHAQHQLDCSV